MKTIQKDELFEHLSGFLRSKGIDLKEGSYAHRIRQGCNLLADAVNLTQGGLAKAKAGIDEKLSRMRQVIHEKTAPKPPRAGGDAASPAAAPAEPTPPPKSRRRRTSKPKAKPAPKPVKTARPRKRTA